ncbi:helix-turn-helix domain-containing protein [Paraburkholderia nemoris]|uniref:helix-turn-helix domain-containing protein n=1 Tax=Paraburkholderia nemoris TaxID=2793076 RepID=UPI001B8C60C8|nr:helix-turn-helix transcriptional regulator [Paraburkholderia nemoris]
MSKPIRKTPSRALVVLSDNLRALAEKNEWTQERLGKETGIGQRQAGRIVNRDIEPKLDTLSEIAEKLRVAEPLLLCPGMTPDQLAIKPRIKGPLAALIERLIDLENEGKLTDQTIAILTSMLAIAMPDAPPRIPEEKKAAQ